MSNSALIINISKDMASLMKATGAYVYTRLQTPKGKEAYRLCMKSCIEHTKAGWLTTYMIKCKIEGLRSETEHLYPKKLFSKKTEEIKCHNMAIDHALEIVSSLEGRFILGQSDAEPRHLKRGCFIYYNNDNLFD